MDEVKDMPVVTVEQISRFRKKALDEIADLRRQLAESEADRARLREAVRHAQKQPYPFGGLQVFADAVNQSQSDWLAGKLREERERCAKVCEEVPIPRGICGQQMPVVRDGYDCAAAIRNLGDK